MQENQQTTGQGFYTNNSQYINNDTLRMRLDTAPLLDKVEAFLRGTYTVNHITEEGLLIQEQRAIGRPKCNELGVQTIMQWLSGTINPQTVQGNFDDDEYRDYLIKYQIDISSTVIDNAYDWEIPDQEVDSIINFIMAVVEPFISRLKDNKERESYNATIRAVENSSVSERGGGFLGFGRRRQ